MGLKFDSILIVTYGRSGSTLLQGVLNSIDGVLIRGENANMCYYMFQTYNSILRAKEGKGRGNTSVESAWYGVEFLDETDFINHQRSFVSSALLADQVENPNIKCVGFKEIRYTIRDIAYGFNNYLDFLRKLFPNVAFVFNTRNIQDTKNSSWWSTQNPDRVEKLLKKTERRFEKYVNKYPKNTFLVTYEDVLAKTERLEQLFDFLGASYNSSAVDKVLEERHSY